MSQLDAAPATRPIIGPEQRAAYAADGCLLVPGLFDAATLAELSDIFDDEIRGATDRGYFIRGEADGTGDGPDALNRSDVWFHNPRVRRFLFEGPLGDLAQEAMGGGPVRIYEDLFLYRAAGIVRPTPWHHDDPQWPLSGTKTCSIWFSLEEVTPETGALRFARGSHKGPQYVPWLPPERQDDLAADMHHFTAGPIPDVDADPERFPVATFTTRPGDALLFSPRTLHAAFGAAQDHPRRSLSFRFLGDDVRWQRRHTAYHDWLRAIDLPDGAPLDHPRFPVVREAA